MEEIIKNLYPMNRCLLGEGYDNALAYINHLIPLDVMEVPSGTEIGTWTVPDEWVVRDAWVKFNGEKIIDYTTETMSLVVGSLPFKGIVTKDELKKHLNYSDDQPDITPYVFKYYDKDWGFSVPKNKIKAELVQECPDCEPQLKAFDPLVGKVSIEGDNFKKEYVDRLEEGEYEVFIDTEYRPGTMKLGVHTIKGKTDKEILLFAHLDHPFQANDNLSSVACLIDLATRLKSDHTIKIIFCPETIGSIAYAHLADISKVEFVIAVEICGNDNTILFQKSFDQNEKINRVTHCALQVMGKSYRQAPFRSVIGSDETPFCDPLIGIPGILLTRHPYSQYHTHEDTPDRINYENIKEMGDLIQKIIEIYDMDYVPVRKFKTPLMRSRYGIQSISPQVNLNYDYLFYSIDGKKSLAELCADFQLNFEQTYGTFEKIIADNKLARLDTGKVKKQPASRKKHS